MAAASRRLVFDDRRHARRVAVEGTAVLHSYTLRMGARLVDLSPRSARLRFARGLELGALDGARVVVDIRLDGARSQWLRFAGTVRRVDVEAGEIAVVFWSIPVDFEDLIQDEMIAALENDVAPRALLVDSDDRRRTSLARAFSAAGWLVSEVSAPLDALSALDDSRSRFALIAIADTVPSVVGEEFRRFVADVHPELTNLVMRMPRSRPRELVAPT